MNGRQFIDFALLAPGVTIGDTTSGSTDVIVEPVTKLSFAGQNIHFNFIAVDGADDISTASGIQRGTPPQESVQEFRVINTDYSTEFGRATAGIVNIITKSGSNQWHGSGYEYFRNDALDAISELSAPDFHVLRQNQFGASHRRSAAKRQNLPLRQLRRAAASGITYLQFRSAGQHRRHQRGESERLSLAAGKSVCVARRQHG